MDISLELSEYYKHLEELSYLGNILSVLYQDMETEMPVKASNDRGEHIALLSKIHHRKTTEKAFGSLITTLLSHQNLLSGKDKRSLLLAKKTYDQDSKVPEDFISEFEKTKSITQNIWNEAKAKNDYALFMPHLKKVFEMSKQYALYINPNELPYNTLLDIYEEGSNVIQLNTIFSSIKEPIQNIITKLAGKDHSSLSYSFSDFPKHQVDAFCRDLVARIGFDFERGNLGGVHHPYQITLSGNDIRINTNFSDIMYAMTSIIHELGHGLYEQNVSPIFQTTNLCGGVSLGIHESQSRLLENIIGRSPAFISFLFPLIKKYFSFVERSDEDLYKHLTKVQPSFIRTESDEVTYNMHIIIRFELEQTLLSGELSFEDLPAEWNKKMSKYLGVTPPTDSQGCMQDVHWGSGLIGYFPTYTLGNLTSAQLWNTFIKQYPDREKHITEGDFSQYFNRFKEHIWQYGSLYTPQELIFKATGEPLNPQYFLDYLEKKYH